MFRNLIESGSHKEDFKRRGSFLLGTLVFYITLLAAAGVGSIYAYRVHLEDPELELVTLMRFPPAQSRVEPAEPNRQSRPATGGGGGRTQVAVVREVSVHTPYNDRPLASPDTPEIRPGMPYTTGDMTFIPGHIGGAGGPGGPNGNSTGGPETGTGRPVMPVTDDVPDRPVRPEPTPQPPAEKKTVSLGVINGRATNKPVPPYPAIARAARASGTVVVQILVDEEGRVISAQATSGHPLLREAAVKAAYQARFSRTLLSNQPVKVSGVITYNFVLQ